MCGIAGLVGVPRAATDDGLGRALGVLSRRGPDGGGRLEARLGAHVVEMGVRRLELTDPEGRSQPARRPSGSILVLNGEVYNHAALRRDLEALGERFEGRGDAEVLAALLEREGLAGLARVEGGYAFAWLPGPEGPLHLGRDPLGVRPLSVGLLPEGIAFASTLDALLAMGVIRPEPDLDSIADVLRDGVVPSCRTALRGVRRVAPGEVLAIDARLSLRSRPVPLPAEQGFEGGVLDALRAAVADRLATPRPRGIFLSGGVDSALIAALARDHGEFQAYTMTFPLHGAVDEARRAQRTARRLGLVHVEVPCPRDPTPWVLSAASAFDEPFADASAIPTWGLALAAGRRIRVALTGTGGDEVFGGYRRYWLLGAGPWLRHVPGFVREPVRQVLERTVPSGARLLRASQDPQGLYRGLLRLQPLGDVRMLVGPRLSDAGDLVSLAQICTPRDAMADDFVRYLPDDLLVKEDRALSAHGMEGRHPFLDRRVRWAARDVELRGGLARGRQKQCLRAFVQEVVDPDLARAPKHGFAFPVDDLYRGTLRPLVEDLLFTRAFRERGFVSTSGAVRVLREHVRGIRDLGAVLHAIVMLELWSRRVLDGAPVRP